MPKTTAWQSQTKWLSDRRYYSERPGIWTDKVTSRDRNPAVRDRELTRKRGVADGFGHFKPRNVRELAVVIIERAINKLPTAQRQAITPRMKWEAVDMAVAGKAADVLRAWGLTV
jgi:hypothetical protein